MEDKLIKEKEMWEKYYNNFEGLKTSLLADILASIKPEERLKIAQNIVDMLENNLKEPIKNDVMLDSINADIKNFDKVNQESSVAIRTIQWVQDELKQKKEIDTK